MRILWIDPGVTSGFCYAEYFHETQHDAQLEFFPTQMVDDVDDLWRRLEHFQPRYLGYESFEYRQAARRGLNLKPVELIGVIKLYEQLATHQVALVHQTAATGKQYYTDVLLKKNGYYVPGRPHGMDATRHLLQWMTFGAGYQFHSRKDDFFKRIETMKWL